MLNQDDGVPPSRAPASPPSARSRVPDLGWQARRGGPQAPRCARRRGASLPRRVDPPDAAPRHRAHGAARLQPAQPALVPRHRGGAPGRWRSLRRPRCPVLGPRQSYPSPGRGAQPPRARPRDPGLLDPRRQGAQPDDGALRPRVRRSLSRARVAHAHRGPPRHPLRPRQRAQARRPARRDLLARLRRSVLVGGRARPGVAAGPDLAVARGLEASGAMSRKRPVLPTGAATQPELWAGATDEPAGSAGPSCPVQPERDVRVKRAQRGQITWGRVDLDAEVPADHEVRAIAAVVDKLDLRGRYADVRARGEIAGAPDTDPKILLGLWVYATSDGVG